MVVVIGSMVLGTFLVWRWHTSLRSLIGDALPRITGAMPFTFPSGTAPYVVAEIAKLSGIVTVVFASSSARRYVCGTQPLPDNLTAETDESV